MQNPKRRVRWGMLGVVSALVLSGASRPKQVAAHVHGSTRAGASPARIESLEPGETALTNAARSPLDPASMRTIPAGNYVPFYKGKSGQSGISVAAFSVAAKPVKQRDFLAFVQRNPRWRRSRVERLFAEASYLADWSRDSDLGTAQPDEVVTKVSWFAAKAYCASLGQRLPTTVEWERALSVLGSAFASATSSNAQSSSTASLWEWTADFNSVPLAEGGANDSVANLFCGAGARATDATDYGAFLRYSFRSSLKADYALKNLGFRCAEAAS
jgi:formylglycine-generating enzyme required for sulfatase activity